MDQQRPFLYLTLFFLGFLIWSTWQQEHAPQPPKTAGATTELSQTAITDSSGIPTGSAVSNTNNASNTAPITDGSAAKIKAQYIHVKTDVLDLLISTQGGTIVQADLPTYPVSLEEKDKAIRIIDPKKKYVAQSGLRHVDVEGAYRADLAPSHVANFTASNTEYVLREDQKQLVVPLTWDNGKGLTITKNYLFERGKFVVKQNQTINNGTQNPWNGYEYLELTREEYSRTGSIFGGSGIAYVGPAYYNNKYSKVSFSDIEDGRLGDIDLSKMTEADKEERLIKGGWAAMIEHYFVSAWIPQQQETNVFYTRMSKANDNYIIGVKSPFKTIATGASAQFDSQFYVGPTDQDKLAAIAKGLDLTVDYGIFAFVSKPIFWVMSVINKYVVSNWGWTIILLTLLIKLLFFYPSAIQYRSMAKMKKLAPKIKAINEKFKNDPQNKQKEIMGLYKKEKANPLAGCLPVILQMPVFMGLYWVLQESVELRQAPWMLWYQDLSQRDPTFILPVLYGASMFLQQKLNPPVSQDPMQQKIFTYLPIVFTAMFLLFPAGLVLYWVVNSILSIAQQWFITKKIIGDD